MRQLVVFIMFGVLGGCPVGFSSPSHLERSEEFSRQGKYDDAIQAYRKHMEYRLGVAKRPEWENPYFYLILIGDIQLGQNKVDEAVKSYKEAEEAKVDQYLISDRYRGVARWYEDRGELARAIQFLGEHRAKDPLLIDAMLDRLAKELVRKEDQTANTTPAPAG